MNVLSYVLAAALVTTGIYAFAPHGADGHERAAATRVLLASNGAAAPAPAASPADASTAAAAATAVEAKNFAYAPDAVTIKIGESVLFKNSDAVAHTVTADDASFDSSSMAEKQTWAHVFAKAGTYKYHCTFHSYMHGTVIVK